ncbi:hypothetical protein L226DRAFT_567689 [Lentinus tigrinus ALCF2SS1-7]|uniref:Jacalin-type lectin domain-containing protein n=1 Tax=Lentinus tigrinus ALCF2SS1-6 TaxID=1328759 RepID=A0A5C2RZN9_9APHY|nr:hypothetical protein L227DRAFT_578705 [Lentinus tigrinus ALCF2SS1-6]RPD79600.1 hypothetical protein L226DRAFT_567689 [Lentinus tigrinus ALCF2SS1-7]
MVTLNSYITTPVFGGQEGELYNDILCTTKDTANGTGGGFWVKDSGVTKAINIKHPLATIVVNADSVAIRGMTVTYRLADGYGNVTFGRGIDALQRRPVHLNAREVLLAVFGRAGPTSRFDPRQVIHNIGFVVFDIVTGQIQTYGPFGNTASTSFGEPFHVTNVVGFGGFHDQTSEIGLSGLFFIKDMNML